MIEPERINGKLRWQVPMYELMRAAWGDTLRQIEAMCIGLDPSRKWWCDRNDLTRSWCVMQEEAAPSVTPPPLRAPTALPTGGARRAIDLTL